MKNKAPTLSIRNMAPLPYFAYGACSFIMAESTPKSRTECEPSNGQNDFFSSPLLCLKLLWGRPSLVSSGFQEPFTWNKAGRSIKLTTHLHILPMLRILDVAPKCKSSRHVIEVWDRSPAYH
jgi:hypothetical protein